MPGSPALIPGIAPHDDEASRFRHRLGALLDHYCVSTSGANCPEIHLYGSQDPQWRTSLTGSLSAWAPGIQLPRATQGHYLPEIIQRVVLGSERESLVTLSDSQLSAMDPHALSIIAVDGPAGLTARAPLADLPGSPPVHRWCESLLNGDRGLSQYSGEELKEAGIIEPELWLNLAKIQPVHAQLIDSGAETGVGRYLALWEVHN